MQNLTVQGDTSLSNLTVNNIAFGNGISINASGVNLNGNVISTNDNSIQIGDLANIRKPVKVFGPLSVNINNPDPTLSFSVGGDVSIGEKRFTNSTSAPNTGTYQLGDICWNTNPIAHNYIGWVCVQSGIPGQWLGFGMIGSQ